MDNISIPIVGEYVWGVSLGYGSFFTMEFGSPALRTQNARHAGPSVSSNVRKALERRRIYVAGAWHFWIQDIDWKITKFSKSIGTSGSSKPKMRDALDGIDSQKLCSVLMLKEQIVFEFEGSLNLLIGSNATQGEINKIHVFGPSNFTLNVTHENFGSIDWNSPHLD